MVKSKNIIAGLGVVAGLGMALLPLGAFAQNGGVGTTDNPARTIRGVVGDVISIELTTDTGEATDTDNKKLSVVDLEPGKFDDSLVHTVKVTTNAQGGYDLKMAADHSDLRYVTAWGPAPTEGKVRKSTAWSETVVIASVEGSNVTLADKTDNSAGAWGYKVKLAGAQEYDSEGFNEIPTSATMIKRKAAPSSPTGEYNDSYDINYGIVPAKTQLSGAYEATITYSAVTNAL